MGMCSTREINGDDPSLDLIGKSEYFLRNLAMGIRSQCGRFQIEHWSPGKICVNTETPGRAYINRFLVEMLPDILRDRKQRVIDILDVGCGSGYIRRIIAGLGYAGSYCGVDVKRPRGFEEHEAASIDSRFVLTDIECFSNSGKFDVIISVSSLEHTKNDAVVITKCSELLKASGVQIHFIPTFWSLFLYLCHGYRQYTPARISRLFKGHFLKVYALGGVASFCVHFFFITIPEIIFSFRMLRSTALYRKMTLWASLCDRYFRFCPAVYVVVVQGGRD